MAEKPPAVGDAPEFPDVVFPIIACPATIAVRFRLKNADERATAKRAIEAAAKAEGLIEDDKGVTDPLEIPNGLRR